MIREFIIAPVIAMFMIGFFLQIVSIADSTSAKVVTFAEDMDNAVDCALSGISIYNCSPNLPSYDFKEDIISYYETNNDYVVNMTKHFENMTNESIVVVIN